MAGGRSSDDKPKGLAMTDRKLDIGLAGHFAFPASKVGRRAAAVEARGWASIWWPDAQIGYHPAAPGRVDAPHEVYDWAPMVAAAACATSTIPVGVCVTDPFRRHPAMLAQTAQTLQDLAEGRFVLGLGLGGIENLAPFGIEGSGSIAVLEEAIDIIRLLWSTTEPVSFQGKRWRLDRAVLGLDVSHHGRPPIWLGGTGPRSLALTGRKADGWVPVMPSVADYGRGLRAIADAARAAGRDPSDITAGCLFLVVTGADEESLNRLLDTPWVRGVALSQPASQFERLDLPHPLGPGRSGMRDFIPTHVTVQEYLELVAQIPLWAVKELVLWGDGPRLAEMLGRYREAGLEHAVIWNLTGLGEPTSQEVRASFQAITQAAELLGSPAGSVS
jgi:phthiodiolone/phenolphthiodiolone dimycocerosates ketoreductase